MALQQIHPYATPDPTMHPTANPTTIPTTNPTIDLFISSQLYMTLASCYDSGHDTCSWVDYGDIQHYDAGVTDIANVMDMTIPSRR